MTKKIEKVSAQEKDWMQNKWRPAMGWMYMMVCVFDFIVFPILWAIVQFWETSAANDAFRQWQPLTLQGAGLFHMAMGAVLGISAYGRTQEKVAGAANQPSMGMSLDTNSNMGSMSMDSFSSTPSTPMPSSFEPTMPMEPMNRIEPVLDTPKAATRRAIKPKLD
jgi:hypothetical protein